MADNLKSYEWNQQPRSCPRPAVCGNPTTSLDGGDNNHVFRASHYPYAEIATAGIEFSERVIQRAADFFESSLREHPVVCKALSVCGSFLLLEFGAALELAEWERQGYRGFLPPWCLTSRQALNHVIHRVENRDFDSSGPHAYPIFWIVLVVWLHDFAWSTDGFSRSEICVGGFDDQFADRIADFIWEHRKVFAAQLSIEDVQ